MVTYCTIFKKKFNRFCAEILLFIKFETSFRYFSLRIISFRTPNFPFRFIAKQAKLTFCFAISLRSFSLPFRFKAKGGDTLGHTLDCVDNISTGQQNQYSQCFMFCNPVFCEPTFPKSPKRRNVKSGTRAQL